MICVTAGFLTLEDIFIDTSDHFDHLIRKGHLMPQFAALEKLAVYQWKQKKSRERGSDRSCARHRK